MLAFCDRPLDTPLGLVAPRYGAATPLRVASNAVMAGCRPEYFPLVMLAIEALCDERFNLYGVNATTHPCTTMIIVNGPVAKELNMNAGHNAFGPGNQANATIGRAVRLVLENPHQAHALAAAGRRFVCACHDWRAIARELESVLAEFVRPASAPA